MVREPKPAAASAMPQRRSAQPAARKASRRESAGTVVLQARVDEEFARELLGHDAAVLGLDGASHVVREGLRLLHRHAQEQAAALAYDAFYSGTAAPLPAGVAPAETD